jgi:uracil-DNA glycosylase
MPGLHRPCGREDQHPPADLSTPVPVAFLFVGVAPPHLGSPCGRTAAKSATNDSGDNLRKFIEEATASRWDDLIVERGLLIRTVKCANVPDAAGFQNPPNHVVDRCRPTGFADELELLRPARIVALGKERGQVSFYERRSCSAR